MSADFSFFSNCDSSDVTDSLDKVYSLLQGYKASKQNNVSEQKISELAKELRNSIRSIEWDLEDLQVCCGLHPQCLVRLLNRLNVQAEICRFKMIPREY